MKSLIKPLEAFINHALLKEQLKRFWAIAALASLNYILLVIMPLWSVIKNREAMFAAENVIDVIAMRNPMVQMMGVIAPFAAALSLFSYLYQPKSTTAMHSYPFSKKQLFFTNMTAGLLLCSIPLMILCAGLLNPVVWRLPLMRYVLSEEGARSAGEFVFDGFLTSLPVELFPQGLAEGAVVNTVSVVAGFFFRALLMNVFYLIVFTLAVMVTGNAVISVLMCGFLPVLPSALTLLGYVTGNFYFFGFEAVWFNEFLMKVFTFTNPVALTSVMNFYYPQYQDAEIPAASNVFLYYAAYIGIAVVLFFAAYWCSRVRKQERAGDSVVFAPFKSVLIFLVSTAGMIFLGAFFLGMLNSVALMYAGLAVGFIIAYFIAQMIAEKTFGVFHRAKSILKYGGIMTWLIIAVVITVRADIGGYQTYLPKQDEIYGVYLYPPYTMNNYRSTNSRDGYRQNHFVTDEKIITDTLFAHSKIISDRHSLRSVFLRSLEGGNAARNVSEQYFTYMLKNGGMVARKYMLTDVYKKEAGIMELLAEPDVILSKYGTFKHPENISRITLQYDTPPDKSAAGETVTVSGVYLESVHIVKSEEIRAVLSEIKKDIVKTELERLAGNENLWKNGINGNTEVEGKRESWYGDHFNLYSYDNVDSWLKENGYDEAGL